MSRPPRILVFDSGAGGLTVARAVRALLPSAELIYAADTAAFPYGGWAETLLVRRIVKVMRELVAQVRPDCVVIACNTASTLALSVLREEFTLPFVGTVPAIKPAAQQTVSGLIGVLATPSTARREYTQSLIHTYAYHCKVSLHGAPRLAELAEQKLAGTSPDPDAIRSEILPVFKQRGGKRTDIVVLGCTHYPLLVEEMEAAAPWPVTWIDPAPAIARRTAQLLAERQGQTGSPDPAGFAANTALFTAAPASTRGFEAMGFTTSQVIDIPV